MPIYTRWYRTATVIAAVSAALLLAVSPAGAAHTPEPADQPASVWTCPTRVDAVAQELRADEFSAQTAKNIAMLTHRECVEGT